MSVRRIEAKQDDTERNALQLRACATIMVSAVISEQEESTYLETWCSYSMSPIGKQQRDPKKSATEDNCASGSEATRCEMNANAGGRVFGYRN